MLADDQPAWLLRWQVQQRQPRPAPPPKLPVGNPNWHKGMASPHPQGRPTTAPKMSARMHGQAAAKGIVEPDPWDFDGCKRREPVFDVDYPPRVVRKVGWHRCLKCRRPFFSEDVLRLRLCSGAQGCRGDEDRFR